MTPRLDLHHDDDEDLPRAARPMFSLVETALLGFMLGVGIACIWLAYSYGSAGCRSVASPAEPACSAPAIHPS